MKDVVMEKQNCHRGYDTFFPEPGTVSESNCGVCGAKCDVKRNQRGSTGWAASMAGVKRSYDNFSCPHKEEPEHKKVRALIAEMKKMMQGDLDIFVSHIRHKSTKKMMEAIDEGIDDALKIFKEENNEK